MTTEQSKPTGTLDGLTEDEKQEYRRLKSEYNMSGLGDRSHSISAEKMKRLIELDRKAMVYQARAQSPAQAEWLPIESAPKDGEDVLLWIPSEGVVDIAYWREDAKAWDTNIGWLQSTPSHWMRPQPPKDDKQ